MDTADRIRMEGYRQHAKDIGFDHPGELVADCRQSLTFFTSTTTRVPTLMRSSQVNSFAKERLMIPAEKLVAQGFPLFLPEAVAMR
eukprot:8566429-Lingulodinium_polyedra.AAC.1